MISWRLLLTCGSIFVAVIRPSHAIEEVKASTCSINLATPYYWEVFQLTPTGKVVFSFSTADAEAVEATEVIPGGLSLEDFTVTFDVSEQTGNVTLKNSLVDIDAGSNAYVNFKMFCTTSDGSQGGNLTDLRIQLMDSNTNPPVFSAKDYTFNVPETFPLNVDLSAFGSVISTTDADTPENSKAAFRFSGENAAFTEEFFYIESTPEGSGNKVVLKLRKALNFDQIKQFSCQITAENPSTPDDPDGIPQTAVTDLVLNVADVFNEPLSFSRLMYSLIVDDPSLSTDDHLVPTEEEMQIQNVAAEHGAVKYRGVASEDVLNQFFKIEENDGKVKFTGTSFEDLVQATSKLENQLVFLVEAVPEANPILKGTAVLVITIIAEAMNFTTVTIQSTAQTIDVTMTATSSSSQLTEGTIPTTLPESPHTESTITSTSPSNTALEFTQQSYKFNVYPVPTGQPVFKVEAKTNLPSQIVYSLEEDAGYFLIDSNTGVTIAKKDLELTERYSLVVTARLIGSSARTSVEVEVGVRKLVASDSQDGASTGSTNAAIALGAILGVVLIAGGVFFYRQHKRLKAKSAFRAYRDTLKIKAGASDTVLEEKTADNTNEGFDGELTDVVTSDLVPAATTQVDGEKQLATPSDSFFDEKQAVLNDVDNGSDGDDTSRDVRKEESDEEVEGPESKRVRRVSFAHLDPVIIDDDDDDDDTEATADDVDDTTNL